jgi:uncharacterized membrane protein
MLASVELFTRAGGIIVSRWGHYLAGVTWIGLLYYFNFVQTPSLAIFEAGPRVELQRKLLGRAMWWFRWGAMLTVLTGFMILGFQKDFSGDYMKSGPGLSISTGILFGLIMWGNVWLVIWPAQKKVIANAERVAGGAEPDPAVPPAARKAALASRTNTMFSIPLLFFMGATAHFAGVFDTSKGSHRGIYYIVLVVIAAFFELNALGVLGGYAPGPTRKFLDDHKQTIIVGFGIWIVLMILWQVLFT